MQRAIAVIAARMGSTRFPGKPMFPLLGMPMIGHVYLRTKMCRTLSDVCVATCDRIIFDYIEGIGGKALMTSPDHERCTDRTAEAVRLMRASGEPEPDVVVMVQGDEPLVTPSMIELVSAPLLADPAIQIANLMAPITSDEQFQDRNEVKVVTDLKGHAMYFSREAIPSPRMGAHPTPLRKQMGIIAFRPDYLERFNALEPTPLEKRESVDMLRLLEHGDPVQMVLTHETSIGVDTPDDHSVAERLLSDDPLLPIYLKG